MKKITTSIITAFLVMLLMVVSTSMVDAKSFGGRTSSSSSARAAPIRSTPRAIVIPSTNRQTSSFGNRAAVVGGAAATTYAASREPQKPKPIVIQRDKVLSSLGGKGATGDAAGLLYKDYQAKVKPISPKAVMAPADAARVFSSDYRRSNRTTYYHDYAPHRYTHMPERQNYGVWDYMMFSAMLDNIGDRQMYYNHQNDPGFQAWRLDANSACQNGDKEICEKLADLDREMAAYRNKGMKIDPTYVTPGIDPSIYTAQNIDTSGLAPIKICAGSVTSDYSRFTNEITTLTKVKTTTQTSNGSADNLVKMANAQCDAAFVQDDLIQTSNLTKLMTLNQVEIVGLACTAPYEHLKDIPKNTTVFVGSDQTGSQFTFNQLLTKLPHLANLKLDVSKTALQAVGDVATTGGCVFGVSTPDSPLFKSMDATNKLKFVPIMSTDFIEGKPTYKMVIVMDSHYKNLTQDKFKGFGGRGGTDTLAVTTSLVAPQAWIDSNKSTFDVLMLNRPALQAAVQ